MQTLVQFTILGIRASLAAVLVIAGAAKLADLQSFIATLTGLGVRDGKIHVVSVLSRVVPLIEISLGLALVTGLWPSVVNAAVMLLMAGFSIVVVVALYKAPHVACRCFGALSESQFSKRGLGRTLLLTALSAVVYWGSNAYSLQYKAATWTIVLLVGGYVLLAAVAAQSAMTISLLKARIR